MRRDRGLLATPLLQREKSRLLAIQRATSCSNQATVQILLIKTKNGNYFITIPIIPSTAKTFCIKNKDENIEAFESRDFIDKGLQMRKTERRNEDID